MSQLSPLPDWPDPDQLKFRKVKNEWDVETLLGERGWFPLADVMRMLDPHETGCYRRIINQRERMLEISRDPVTVMGLRRFGSRLWADMPVFSRWVRLNEPVWQTEAAPRMSPSEPTKRLPEGDPGALSGRLSEDLS